MVESIDWLVGSGIRGIRGAAEALTRIDEPAAVREELAEIPWQYGEDRIETSVSGKNNCGRRYDIC